MKLAIKLSLLCFLWVAAFSCGFKQKEEQGKAASNTKEVKKPTLDSLQHYIDRYVKLSEEFIEHDPPATEQYEKLESLKATIQNLTSQIVGSKKLNFKGGDYYVFVADLDKHEIKLHWKAPKTKEKYKSIGALLASNQFKDNKALMIANAGMYTAENNPKGLYVEEGKELIRLDTVERKSNVNFYLLPNGVFYIDDKGVPYVKNTPQFWVWYKRNKDKVKIATQSGPMLVINGEMHNKFRYQSPNVNIRNGVGVINQKKVVFAISYGLVNFYDFASFYKDIFGCENALYLDGAISRTYLHDLIPNERSGNFGPMVSVVEK